VSPKTWIPATAVALLAAVAAPATTKAAVVERCVAAAADGEPAATFSLVEGEDTELPLDRRLSAQIQLEFNVTGCRFARRTTLGFDRRLFRKGGATLDPKGVDVSAEATGDEAVVTLKVSRDSAEPGRYVGAIVLEPESRLGQKARVPVTVTVKYREMSKLAWIEFLVTFALGSLVVWLKGVATGSTNSFLQCIWRLEGDALKRIALDSIAIGAGLLAAFGAWKSGYMNNATWGAGDPFWDGVDLLLVMVAAYIAAATGATLGTDPARQSLAPATR
jgi:hypothetical protein